MRKLNEEQQKAVDHDGGPAVLLAAAGSGKTFTMVERVRHLIVSGVTPTRILVITFTNKAANELLERLDYTDDDPHPKVSTIHSLALSFIRRDPLGFGLGAKVTPIDDYDQKVLVDTVVEKLKLEEKVKSYQFLEKLNFHRARGIGFREDYTPEVHARVSGAYGGSLTLTDEDLLVWGAYEKAKQDQSVLDFNDMLHFVVRRGNTDQKWLTRVQGLFDHILMDEAQDTSALQWSLINLLFRPDNHNAFVVGDLSQSIFGFIGASPSILYEFTQGWRGEVPTVYKLVRNHRSVPEVVGLANRIQKTMTETVPLRMESWRGEQGERGVTSMITSASQLSMAEEIASAIARERRDTSLSNFAILVRSGSQVKDLEPALVKRKIPYIIRGASGFLQTQEVKDILSYLRVAVNPLDYAAFSRSATAPKRGVGPVAMEKLRTQSEEYGGDLIQTCVAKGVLVLYAGMIKKLQTMKEDPLACLDHAIKASGYMKHLEEKVCKVKGKVDKDKLEMKTSNLARLRETFEAMVETTDLTLDDMVFQLAMNGDKDVEDEEGRVVISTIHSSKGLEWPKVFLFGVYEGQMPHKFSQAEAEVEEERRLFYVACTRARDHLVLGIPNYVITPYSETAVVPSRFLYETSILKR